MFENPFGGLLGLIYLVVMIWAAVRIIQTNETPLTKALWIAGVFVVPVIGFIVWWIWGPK